MKDPLTRARLAALGWSPARDLGGSVIAEWEKLLPQFVPSPESRSALRSFGLIASELFGGGTGPIGVEPFCLDPLKLGEQDKELLQDYEEVMGEVYFPLGLAFQSTMSLVIVRGGAVYGYRDGLWRVGNAVEEAVSNLVLGDRFPQLEP